MRSHSLAQRRGHSSRVNRYEEEGRLCSVQYAFVRIEQRTWGFTCNGRDVVYVL